MKLVILLLALTLQTYTLLYDNTTYYLGNNLITNSDFSIPDINSARYMEVSYSITGWNCNLFCEYATMTTLFQS